MNKTEARQLLADTLAPLRQRPYDQLCALVGQYKQTTEVTGTAGVRYQVGVFAVWDFGKPGDVRVCAGIDDFGWRAFAPLTDSFIMAPDGSFVGEY